MTDRENYNRSQTSGWSRRRNKQDWAGRSLSDAFNPRLYYYERLAGETYFFDMANKIQKNAARLAGVLVNDTFTPKTKPQLAAFYTSFPRQSAAYAALGHTGFLEFQARAGSNLLMSRLAEMDVPNDCDPAAFQRAVQIVAETVQTRLLMDEVRKGKGLGTIEAYRVFLSNQQESQPRTLREILDRVILYGDVLLVESDSLHPTTAEILGAVAHVSRPFLDSGPAMTNIKFGLEWIHSICEVLARFIPRKQETETTSDIAAAGSPARRLGTLKDVARAKARMRAGDRFEPLNAPCPPLLDDLKSSLHELIERLAMLARPNSSPDVLKSFSEAVLKVGGHASGWRDMRADLVEEELRITAYRAGPIEGSSTEGREVSVELGTKGTAKGEVFDRAVAPSNDSRALERLRKEAEPITQALRANLYPSVEESPERKRFQTGGSIDGSRLPYHGFRENIFKRLRVERKPNPEGRAVLAIACDASGSLSPLQMRLTKVLACSFLSATRASQIECLAAIYHSGHVRKGVVGPLTQWLFHPNKTPAISRNDALRALVGVPDVGTGSQSDALSLQLILDEAQALARGAMVYLVLISDTAWNRSFPQAAMSGAQEVEHVLKGFYNGPAKLHTTLVGVGVEGMTGFERIVDKVLLVSQNELADYVAVANRIGTYVAGCIQERRRWLNRQ